MANVFIEEQYMSDIANAIRNRTGKTDSIYPENMSEEILSIGADATVAANEMVEGATAYVDGEVITGEIPLWNGISWSSTNASWDSTNSRLKLSGSINARRFLESNTSGTMYCAGSNLGDALPEDVAVGKTFTSASGLKVTGTLEQLDTSDANATASDIANGVTAYVDGELVTGNVKTTNSNISTSDNSSTNSVYKGSVSSGSSTVDYIYNQHKFTLNELFRQGSSIGVGVPCSEYGTATAEDVASGKTFTSVSGLKVTGTASMNNGSIVKTGTTTSSTINTGLSEIKAFFLDCSANSGAGLCTLSYSSDLEYMTLYGRSSYAQAVTRVSSSSNDYFSVSGGTVTITAASSTSYALRSNVTYYWVAIGTE